MLTPCPACEQAVAKQAPLNAHACCARDGAHGAPAFTDSVSQNHPARSEEAPSAPDCSRFPLTRMLAMLERGQAPEMQATATWAADAASLVNDGIALTLSVPSVSDLCSKLHFPAGGFPPSPAGPMAGLSPLRL